MSLEIAAEEADIGEMVLPSYLLDALTSALELHLQLENDVLVDDGLGGVSCHLAHDVGEILGGDVHLVGIIVDIPRQFVVFLQEHHEATEQFSNSIRLYVVGTILRISLQVLVEADEECFQLAEYQLGDARAFRLVEIDFEQGKHAVDDVGDHWGVLATAVFSQGGIDGLLQLETCFPKQRRVVF